MMQHPVQPYKGLNPHTALATTRVPSGETTAEKPLSTTFKHPKAST